MELGGSANRELKELEQNLASQAQEPGKATFQHKSKRNLTTLDAWKWCCVPRLSCIQRDRWEQHPGGLKCKLKNALAPSRQDCCERRPILAKAAVGELLESLLHAACIGAISVAGAACALCACWQHTVQFPPSRALLKAAEVHQAG